MAAAVSRLGVPSAADARLLELPNAAASSLSIRHTVSLSKTATLSLSKLISPIAAATSSGLLGPPEIYHRPETSADTPTASDSAASAAVSGDPFLDLIDARFNSDSPTMGLTENQSPTFVTSGDPCLDFFFQVAPNTDAKTLTHLLSSAWEKDPLTALKLACNLRAVRGTGKSDREGFYAAASWIHSHHPKTLALNAPQIAQFGYMKDLPEILHRLIAGLDSRKRTPRSTPDHYDRYSVGLYDCFEDHQGKLFAKKKKGKLEGTREEKLAAEMAKVKIQIEKAALLRRTKRTDMAARAVERYARDPDYRFLHDQTSELFAQLLAADLDRLSSGDLKRFSLAAKWCPSLNSSYDLSTLLCESIARRLFPRDSDAEYLAIEEEHYAYRVRDRLRREVLVPLRRAMHLPEVYMSAREWASLPYSRVASVAMKNYKELFLKHDSERFLEFLSRVKRGKAKIAAGAVLPHEILAPALRGEDDEVAELQWRRMVSDLSEEGKLKNCIAVCDVSGSMEGTPMDVCIALGLLISELSEEPWKGRVITFSANPQIHWIKGDSIREKASFVENMQWNMNTDFQRVFDRLLEVVVEGKLEPEKMVKRVFVFSDMEFDQASANSWETDYEAICRKFGETGYGSAVPEIVFWNLKDSRSTPVPSYQKGVALVSGFSKNLMKLFFKEDGVLNPLDTMEAAIAGDEYKKLVVFD